MPSSKPLIAVVGGFLGAGKTSLILCAADILRAQGIRAAIVTNDQGLNLIDSQRARAHGVHAAEIGGGCFCCRFSDLIEGIDLVMQHRPDVIFAEPVGSCTDLAATVLRPLQSLHADRFRIAPLTVLIDPDRAAPDDNADIQFLFESQIREADLLCYTKADRHSQFPEIGGGDPLRTSAATGQGVREWLQWLMAFEGTPGGLPLDIDYDQYAAAEASLGWLNARVDLVLDTPASPAQVIGPLLEQLDERLSLDRAIVAHLKVFDQAASSYLTASITRNGAEPGIDGDLLAPPERRHELTINLRAIARPEQLRQIVESAFRSLRGSAKIDVQAFSPAYPKPEKRIGTPCS